MKFFELKLFFSDLFIYICVIRKNGGKNGKTNQLDTYTFTDIT